MSKTFLNRIISNFSDFGERPPLNQSFEDINQDLQFSYQLVSYSISSESILDYGCGGGYGTEYLSRFTKSQVVGYDVDKFTINQANNFFKSQDNLSFLSTLPKDKRFNLIVSFQVIEHLNANELTDFFKNIKSLLTPKGRLFIATPNKNISSFNLKIPSFSHHVKEYNPKDLKNLLKKHFKSVKIYGQIDKKILAKVKKNQFTYSDLSNITPKVKIVRILSQIEIFRFIARIIPQKIKNLLLFQTKVDHIKYQLVTKKTYINNSYILIAKCLDFLD